MTERGDGRRHDGRVRVVITGMGAITPMGLSVDDLWEGLVEGRSAIDYFTKLDATKYPTKFGGEVRGFDPTLYMDPKRARRMEVFSQFAVAAAEQALEDSGLEMDQVDRERFGVVLGTAVGGLSATEEATLRVVEGKKPSAFYLTSTMPNAAAFHLAHLNQLHGYNITITTACAAGTQSVGEGAEVIRRGAADLVLTGGTEGATSDVAMAGFVSMRAFSTRNDNPQGACRPFDKDRDGFVGSEGSGVLLLERLDHALARGARIYAEVLGFGATSDAYHLAAPDPEAKGAIRTIRWALRDSGVNPEDVDYINAHGTSTPLGDVAETLAIKTALGEHAYDVPVSSTKSMLGHCFGAAGAVEAIATALTIHHQVIHPTINYETPDPACDLDYVPNEAREADVRICLSESFGLGGQDACLALGRFDG